MTNQFPSYSEVSNMYGIRAHQTGASFFENGQQDMLDLITWNCLKMSRIILPVARLAIWAEDFGRGGPSTVFLPRVGKSGVMYGQYKLRTMADGSHLVPDTGRTKSAEDGRITKIGKFLRKTSIDELPQYLNIQDGTMSFIGPRPKTPEKVAELNADPSSKKFWDSYILGKPGISGLEQNNGRTNHTNEQIAMFTTEWAENASVGLYLEQVARTFKTVAESKNAH